MVRSWDVAGDLPAVDLRSLLSGERFELVAFLRRLSSSQWRSPTACEGWSVHDIALHLLGNDFGRTSAVSLTSREGTEAFAALAAVIEESNEAWVRSARRIGPELLPDLLTITGSRVDDAFASTDLHEPGVAVVWTGTGPSPAWLDIAREYTERWVHQAQIREAVGEGPLLAREWLEPVLDTFMRCLPRAFDEVTAPVGSSVAVDVTGAAGGRWWVERDVDRWRLKSPRQGPDASVEVPDDVMWRLLARLGDADAARRSARVSGVVALANTALSAVAVMTTRV